MSLSESYDQLPSRARLTLRVLMIAAVVAGSLFYFKGEVRNVVEVGDYYDLTYYYTNSKYFPELGYKNLYEALLVADEEGAGRWRGIRRYRDLTDYRLRGRGDALKRREAIKARFSDDRWAAFKHDVDFLSRQRISGGWAYFFKDHGYNPPPTWTFMARFVTTWVPIEQVKVLCLIDMLLVILMFAGIFWAFGELALLFALMFFFWTFSGHWPLVGQALLRFDWLACSVLGLCAYRKGRPFAAGALLMYAASMRVFPAVFTFPIVVEVAADLWAKRTIRPDNRRILLGVGAVALLLGVGALTTLGPSAFVDGAEKIALHAGPDSYSSARTGFGDFLVFQGETTRAQMNLHGGTLGKGEQIRALLPYIRWVGLFAFAFFAAFHLARHRERPWLSLFVGPILLFILTTPQINYLNCRVLLMIFAALDLNRRRGAFLAGALLLTEGIVQASVDWASVRYFSTSLNSTLLTVIFLVLGLWMLIDLYRNPRREGGLHKGQAPSWLRPRHLGGGLAVALGALMLPYLPTWASSSLPEPDVVDAAAVSRPFPEGHKWNRDTHVLELKGIEVRFGEPVVTSALEMSTDGNDYYQLELLLDGDQVGALTANPPAQPPGGLYIHRLEVPRSARGGFDAVRIRPKGGDNLYSVGHLVPTDL